jgi:hypothetical protein
LRIAPSSDLFLIIVVESGVIRFCLATEQAMHFGIRAFETFVPGWIFRRANSPFSFGPRDDSGLARIERTR